MNGTKLVRYSGTSKLGLSGNALSWIGMLLLGVLGIALIVAPDITFDRIPGDIGDARFNRYVLEHFHLWLTGKTPEFWSAPFFFPFPLTIAFSDNHLGTGIVYSLFRLAGFDPEDSFCGWYLVGYIVNYAAACFALKKLGCGNVASAAGAFLFAFGLPITAQEGHAQLIYRFGVPLAVLSLIEYERRPRLQLLAQLSVWTVWQFYCSIYIGVFLLLLLMAIWSSCMILDRGSVVDRLSRRIGQFKLALVASSAMGRVVVLILFVLSAGALVALAVPYMQVGRIYHFARSWAEIATMLPRIQSYFLSNNSLIWNSSWSGFHNIPMWHEHSMFSGIAPFLAVTVYLFVRRSDDGAKVELFRTIVLAVALIVIVTLYMKDFSIYRLIATVPGFNAVRAVTRICVVLLFPVAILTAIVMDRLLDRKTPAHSGSILALVIVAVMVVEAAAITHYSSLKSDWHARIDRLVAQLPSKLPSDPIVFVGPAASEPAFAREIDGMILAQSKGWRTLNGYSGNVPPGHVFSGNCLDVARNLVSGERFAGVSDDISQDRLARQVVPLGYEGCPSESLTKRIQVTESRGPLAFDQMSKTAVHIEQIDQQPSGLVVTISITNNSSGNLPAISSSGTPVRISAIYVSANIANASMIAMADWKTRQDLMMDVPSGASERFEVPIQRPPAPGDYRIAVSLVQDGVAWFHDHGMEIALSDPVSFK